MRMRLLPLTGVVVTLSAAILQVPVIGDESCDATSTSADASGRNVCSPNVDDSHDVVIDDDAKSSEEAEHPIWWDYDIDDLFEDYFDCGAITYGYENAGSDDSDDDSSDDDDDDVVKESGKEVKVKKNSDVVSDAQLQKLRHQWAMMREKYVKEVNLVPVESHKAESDSNADGNRVTVYDRDAVLEVDEGMRINNHGVSAIVVPCQIGDAGPHKGRGVYATEPIKEGELVVSLDNGSTAIFKEGHSWREFAVSLPREAACNFIEWSWVQTISPRNKIDDDIRNGLTIFISFDESNLMNAADWDGVEANIRCGTAPKRQGDERGTCQFHYYAARDIAVGEELLINYGEFEDLSQQGWVDIGL